MLKPQDEPCSYKAHTHGPFYIYLDMRVVHDIVLRNTLYDQKAYLAPTLVP
jgi:hypothetical protein